MYTATFFHLKSNYYLLFKNLILVTFFTVMGSLQHSMATLFNRNHGTHEESSPQEGSSNKALINPIWKFRILAILAICVLVIPGNIVTLSIYLTSEGMIVQARAD